MADMPKRIWVQDEEGEVTTTAVVRFDGDGHPYVRAEIADELLAALKDCVAELSPFMTAYRPQHYEAIIGKANAAIARAEAE